MDEKLLGPNVAGGWYPADPSELGSQLDGFLERRESTKPARSPAGDTVALIAPHAGYVYSGAIAGAGFRLLRGSGASRVLLVGPSHHASFQGAALPEAESYATPLGEVAIDGGAVARLGGLPGMSVDNRPFRPEHCLEMEIPFLQRVLAPGWKLLPVLIGGGSRPDSCARVAESLAAVVDDSTLLVVSSDFTHFGPRFGYTPFRDDVPRRLRELDLGAVQKILDFDRAGFESYVDRTGATICGRRPIEVLLGLLPDDVEGSLVAYDTSGRITGDWVHSVSYASLAFRRGAA
jgi:AmmeMemoRadiSam system protein B